MWPRQINFRYACVKLYDKFSNAELGQIYLQLTNSKDISITEPGKLVIELSNAIQINRSGMNTAIVSFLKEELNFFNAEFIIKKNSGRNTFGIKRYFKFIDEVKEYAIIPNGFIRKLLVYCFQNNIEYQLDDCRKLLPPANFSFQASLRAYQLPASYNLAAISCMVSSCSFSRASGTCMVIVVRIYKYAILKFLKKNVPPMSQLVSCLSDNHTLAFQRGCDDNANSCSIILFGGSRFYKTLL